MNDTFAARVSAVLQEAGLLVSDYDLAQGAAALHITTSNQKTALLVAQALEAANIPLERQVPDDPLTIFVLRPTHDPQR